MAGRIIQTPPLLLIVADYTCVQTGIPLLVCGLTFVHSTSIGGLYKKNVTGNINSCEHTAKARSNLILPPAALFNLPLIAF
jgi:hypothetical protein